MNCGGCWSWTMSFVASKVKEPEGTTPTGMLSGMATTEMGTGNERSLSF